MSKEKLTLCTLSGPLNRFDYTIQTFVINRDFHPVNTTEHMKGLKALIPFDNNHPFDEVLHTIDALSKELNIALDYRPFDVESITSEDAGRYFFNLAHRVKTLSDEKNELKLTITDNQNIIETLKHMGNLKEGIESIMAIRSAKSRFGRMPRHIYDDSHQWINSRVDSYFITTSVETDYVYGVYFLLPSLEEKADSFFASLGFERIWISQRVHGTPQDAITNLDAEIKELNARIIQLDSEFTSLRIDEKDKFLKYYSYVKFISECYSIRSYAGHSIDNFYIVGWIPLESAQEYSASIETQTDLSCILTDVADMPNSSPPIKRKVSLLSRLYTPYLEMYGLPSYREFDPSIFLALTYTIFFGIMFGDVGQGVLILGLGLYLYRVRHMWLGGILSCCGTAAIIFGFIYGSVFGSEELIHGFQVLEGDNAIKILLISAGIGVVMITVCMIINIFNGIIQKDIEKIFFSANGVCGLVFYLSAVLGLVATIVAGINVFTVPYIIILIILPLLLILFKEPITKLIEKRPDWKPESIGSLIIEGFFELFETVLSYVSNTISFLRIGAFAISHAGMMMVVFMLAGGASGGYNPIVLVIGNIFVTGLEALLVCIQVLRLEFYELFGRFYGDSGEKFTPLVIDYTKILND